jgi:phospholipid-binding lipoprotein MlaA
MNANHRTRSSAAFAATAIALSATGCATGPNANPQDPLEPLNRATYQFNDSLDRYVAKPVAKGYNKVVPQPVRSMVDNFFANLGDVTVMFNDFFQLHFMDGMNDLMRVGINSTFGVLGTIDIASKAGIEKRDQDFGLTLAHYGMPSGPYLVLPLFGPSTFRDAAGFGVDQYMAPVNQTRPAVRNTLWGIDFISSRARYLQATNLLEEAALDKYLFTRDAWLGQRKEKVGGEEAGNLPNYEQESAPGQPQAKPQGQPQTQPQPQPQGQPQTQPQAQPQGQPEAQPQGQ